MDDNTESRESINSTDGEDQKTDAEPSGDGTTDRNSTSDIDGVHETQFKVRGSDFEFEVSASARFENHSVTVTGTIQGNNTCYTARLGNVAFENQRLTLNVESYDDSGEDVGCGEAVIGINYEAVIHFDADPPTAVTVEHNNENVTTEQAS